MLTAGLIGCGRIGSTKHIDAFADNKNLVSLEYVCDTDRAKANLAARRYFEKTGKRPKVVSNHLDVLASKCDFIDIATESGLHANIAVDGLSNNKHVLVEKPMALSTRDTIAMRYTATQHNKKLGVCYQNRFNPTIQELYNKLQADAFGKIHHITARVLWHRDKAYFEQSPWRGTHEMDGGALFNQCSHSIDLIQWFANSLPDKITGTFENFNHPYCETEDFAVGIIRFFNGTIGIIEGSINVYPKNLESTISVFGETGTAVIGGTALNKILTWEFENERGHDYEDMEEPPNVYGYGHTPLLHDFCKAIIDDRQPLVNGYEGQKSVGIINAIINPSTKL